MFKFTVKGVVQGVGFRPYIYNQCLYHGLTGTIKNTGNGVEIIINNRTLMEEILKTPPELAVIDSIETEVLPTIQNFTEFKILKSSKESGQAMIPPDICICQDCIKEISETENDRRYKYFFNTCTNCGPRFSIIQKTPYDRPYTTMAPFEMCPQCRQEYQNPSNRRYHAQTTCCPKCGPQLQLYINQNQLITKNIISKTISLIKADKIVAIKGIGGFHLCCNTHPKSVAKLKKLRNRQNKPLAIMVPNIEMAAMIVKISRAEKEILQSKERPILLLEKNNPNLFAEMSPLSSLGIMLPYTGIHYLLFQHLQEPLIMTSSNAKDQPITTEKSQQFVSHVLSNPRKIHNAIDDSVVKVIKSQPFYIRKSRGYTPQSINIPFENKDLLAMGAMMQNTVSFYQNGKVLNSQHLGNINSLKSLQKYKDTIARWLDFQKITPSAILCDKHPDYETTKYARQLAKQRNIPLFPIQHHQAHICSAAIEHKLDNFIGIACDGTGYGDDGTVWGGEIFLYYHNKIKRVGSLQTHRLIGGDQAVKEPLRIAIAILEEFMIKADIYKFSKSFYNSNQFNLIYNQLQQNFNIITSSSCGRVLDAAAALLGVCRQRTYQGEPAMMLESATSGKPLKIEPEIKKDPTTGFLTLQITPLFKFLIANYNLPTPILAATVHQYLARGLWQTAQRIKFNFNFPIVYSGGVAYNKWITSYLMDKKVLVNQQIPCGDAGIAFGQIAAYFYTQKHNL